MLPPASSQRCRQEEPITDAFPAVAIQRGFFLRECFQALLQWKPEGPKVQVTWNLPSQRLPEEAPWSAQGFSFSPAPIYYWQIPQAWLQAASSEFVQLYKSLC